MNKKKEIYLTLGIAGTVVYIMMCLLIIHVQHVKMENTKYSALEALMAGIDDLTRQPFAIWPIPHGAVGTIILMTTLILFFGIMAYATMAARAHYNTKTVQGDAEWLTSLKEYNRRFTDPIGKPTHNGPNNMILSNDLYMSLDNQKIRRNMNVFVIGGSGAGKSYCLVGPNLMQANTSYVITDPSGGLFKEYGSFFEYMGYKVKCFNLDHMDRGNHYNPFNYIHSDKDIEILVTTLISNTTPPDSKSNDPFWEKSETALLLALIAYLHHYATKECQNFASVMELMRSAQVTENDSDDKSPLDYLFDDVKEAEPDSFAVKQYQTFRMGAGRTLKSILISCAVRLQAFDLLDVARLTGTDDIDLDSVGDEKTALFVIIPTGEKTFNFLAAMMYSQLFQRLYGYCENTAAYSQLIVDSDNQLFRTFRAESPEDAKRARAEAEAFFERAKNAEIRKNKDFHWYELRTEKNELVGYRGTEEKAQEALEKLKNGKVLSNSEQSNHGQRLPIHVRLMLDEFPNTGKIPEFSEKVATIRKYEISTTIILQSLQQMKNLYKDEWETISGNCDNTIYLGGGADTTSSEWISKLLGKETRVVMNASYSEKGGSTSYNRTGVELYTPSQLRTMPEDECIVIPKSLSAFKGRKFIPDKHPNRQLVKDLEKELGGYWYNPQKTRYLLEERLDLEKVLEEHHGEVLPENEEIIAEANNAAMQAAEEFRQNIDANGEAVVGQIREVKTNGEGLEDTVPMADGKESKASVQATIEANDEFYAPDEIIYSSAPASLA